MPSPASPTPQSWQRWADGRRTRHFFFYQVGHTDAVRLILLLTCLALPCLPAFSLYATDPAAFLVLPDGRKFRESAGFFSWSLSEREGFPIYPEPFKPRKVPLEAIEWESNKISLFAALKFIDSGQKAAEYGYKEEWDEAMDVDDLTMHVLQNSEYKSAVFEYGIKPMLTGVLVTETDNWRMEATYQNGQLDGPVVVFVNNKVLWQYKHVSEWEKWLKRYAEGSLRDSRKPGKAWSE